MRGCHLSYQAVNIVVLALVCPRFAMDAQPHLQHTFLDPAHHQAFSIPKIAYFICSSEGQATSVASSISTPGRGRVQLSSPGLKFVGQVLHYAAGSICRCKECAVVYAVCLLGKKLDARICWFQWTHNVNCPPPGWLLPRGAAHPAGQPHAAHRRSGSFGLLLHFFQGQPCRRCRPSHLQTVYLTPFCRREDVHSEHGEHSECQGLVELFSSFAEAAR